MVLTISPNTYAALQNATRDGVIIPRDFVWITARNRQAGTLEHIGLWSGRVAMTIPVIRPDTGEVEERVYQPLAGRMKIPAIPMEMGLKVQSLTLTFSNLSPAVTNALRVFDARKQSIQIHRTLLDPMSRKIVDPAHCRWDGIINRAPVTQAAAGDDGKVEVATSGHNVWLTMASGDKMDAHFFERRGDKAGKDISTIWKVPVPWHRDEIVHVDSKRPKLKFYRGGKR